MKIKTVKVILIFLITIILAAAFIACDPVGGGGGGSGSSGESGGTGGTGGGGGGGGTGGGTGGGGGGSGGSKVILTIYLPSSSGNNSEWPHYYDPTILDKIVYNITVSGNGETIQLTKTGKGTVQETVSVGYLTVSVVAFYPNNTIYAVGSTSVEVKAGQPNNVSFDLSKPPVTPIPDPNVINVTISPSSATVTIGNSQQFTATVTGTTNMAVTWTLTGGTEPGTIINNSGFLSVDAAEAVGTTLTVTATSNADPTKSASATVTVINLPTYTVSGTITTSGGMPISGATVELESGGITAGTATTGSTGGYSISGILNGTYTIEVSATGYAGTDTVTVSSANVTKNMALAPITYTVVFNAGYIQGGTTAIEGVAGSTATQTFSYGETKALTANGFSREGFTFAGWSTAANGTAATTYTNSQSVSNLATANGATVNLYARWNFQYAIGVTGPGGGTIFWRNENGVDFYTSTGTATEKRYYLEAANTDIPDTVTFNTFIWGTLGTNIAGTSTAIGTGLKNTLIIIASLDPDAQAAAACRGSYNAGGTKTDWFLPSSLELQALNSSGVFTFSGAAWWSSSQADANNAYLLDYLNASGTIEADLKDGGQYVRAIRAF